MEALKNKLINTQFPNNLQVAFLIIYLSTFFSPITILLNKHSSDYMN